MLNPVITSAEQIIAVMRADPRRQLYTDEGGGLWIDHQGGMVASADSVRRLLEAGVLRRAWPDVDGCWVLTN